ncbi:hypothetical protein BGZ94_006220 [Podila epigama]|nr:hypothetical protein BGZ94_006220 [Podila epigama]
MGTNGSDFSSGFGNHVRSKTESDLVTGSPLVDVFSKSYHHQQPGAHHLSTPPGSYHGLPHLGISPQQQPQQHQQPHQQHQQQQHHHPSHPYSPQHTSFPPAFGYNVSNGNGNTALTNGSDQTATTPPPIRYQPPSRNHQQFMSYPQTSGAPSPQSSQASSQQQQQRHNSLSPSQYGGGSPAMMMPSPGHEFNLPMGYHSPAPTVTSSTFNGLSAPQQTTPQQAHYHHQSLPPSTQGWDFGYSSYTTPTLGTVPSEHYEKEQDSSSSP